MNVRLRRSLNVISGRPWDGQIGSLGDVPRTLEGDVLGTSWRPIFAGWGIGDALANCGFLFVELLVFNLNILGSASVLNLPDHLNTLGE